MVPDVTPEVARKLWRSSEPLHGMIYFVPEAHAAYSGLGLQERSGYFVSRAAPMGAVTAEVVTATFFNFHPALVGRAMQGAWEATTVAEVLAARAAAADAALRRLLGDLINGPEVSEAATLARRATEGCTIPGRPLAAGHLSLVWPEAPHVALWHGLSVLREFRGDGHIAALVADGRDGVEALVMHGAADGVPRVVLQQSRAWSDAEWASAAERLRSQGLVDGDGGLTDAGRQRRQWVEDRTDVLALPPWQHLGPTGCARLRELVRPLSRAVVEAGTFAAGLPGLGL
jgi:hypothetical protein